MTNQIRAIIADDRPRSRDGLRALLATTPEIAVVSEAANGQQAVHQAETLQPDVVLMDVYMPVLDGLQATRIIKESWPQIKVIILTIDSTCKVDALAAGADAFLVKGGLTTELLATILTSGKLESEN
jgi:DNA-binding NarL/FixJ family response regulator